MQSIEEKKERKRQRQRAYYQLNKEKERERKNKWREENLEHYNQKCREYSQKKYDERKDIYVVYTHLNTEGSIYIGSGNLNRVKSLANRSKNHKEAFKNELQSRVLKVCETRQEALELEQELIDLIGLDYLVNEINAIRRDVKHS